MILFLNLIAIVILMMFIWRLSLRQKTILDFGVLFSVTLILNYPIRLITLHIFKQDALPQYYGLTAESALMELSQIQFLGIFGFMLGYLLSIRGRDFPLLDKQNLHVTQTDISIIWVVFLISLLAKIYKIATGNYISFLIGQNIDIAWANTIENFHSLGWVCFAAVWGLVLSRSQRNRRFLFLFYFVNIVQLSYQIFQGSKTFLLLPILIIIFTFYYFRKRLTIFFTIFLLVFATIFVFPFVSSFRDYMNQKFGTIPEFSEFSIVETISESFRRQDSVSLEKSNLDKVLIVMKRFGGADELYNLNRLVPKKLPYKMGNDFASILVTPIPRAFWPDKPIYSPGAEYGKILGTRTSITPFPFGEMIWNFGVLGLFPAMVLWGVVLGQLMKGFNYFFVRVRSRLFIVSIFLSELYWIITGETMLPILVSSMIKKVIIIFVVYQLAIFIVEVGAKRNLTHANGKVT